MTKLDIEIKIKALREELENRFKYGTIKMATIDGTPIPTETLQNELFKLIYKLSKFE